MPENFSAFHAHGSKFPMKKFLIGSPQKTTRPPDNAVRSPFTAGRERNICPTVLRTSKNISDPQGGLFSLPRFGSEEDGQERLHYCGH